MSNRGTKFYRKNEKEIMKELGFSPTINSGAGWIQKEDGENDIAVCQLKSTDKASMSVKNIDLRQLEANALISHKIPVFAVQFLETGDIWLMLRPCDVNLNLSTYDDFVDSMMSEEIEQENQKDVDMEQEGCYNSSIAAREKFWKDRQEEKEQREREVKGCKWKRKWNKRG